MKTASEGCPSIDGGLHPCYCGGERFKQVPYKRFSLSVTRDRSACNSLIPEPRDTFGTYCNKPLYIVLALMSQRGTRQ
jgi:hypothetical protein